MRNTWQDTRRVSLDSDDLKYSRTSLGNLDSIKEKKIDALKVNPCYAQRRRRTRRALSSREGHFIRNALPPWRSD